MAILKRIGKKWINSYWRRLLILVGAAVAGYALSKWGFPWLDCWLGFSPRVDKYLEPLLFGLPVFIWLWFFRTYDTQQQIQQGNFVAGVDKLVQSDPMVIAVGVNILLQVSAKTDSFDDAIRDAFVNRLRKKPTIPSQPVIHGIPEADEMPEFELKQPLRLTYAQHILWWLTSKQDNYADKPDLRGMRCDYQEFKIDGIDLVKILPAARGDAEGEVLWGHAVSLLRADCQKLNFDDGVEFGIFAIKGAINVIKDGESCGAGAEPVLRLGEAMAEASIPLDSGKGSIKLIVQSD